MTGFNRRFSPHLRPIRGLADRRLNPFVANYRMNAGHIPSDHWVHGEEGGGRNIGEACHIYDLFTALANSEAVAVQAQARGLAVLCVEQAEFHRFGAGGVNREGHAVAVGMGAEPTRIPGLEPHHGLSAAPPRNGSGRTGSRAQMSRL